MKRNLLPPKTYKLLYSLFMVIMAVILLCLILYFKANAISRNDFREVTHIVRAGETPWSIADEYCPAELDKRLYLAWCAEENGITSWSYIYPGDTLVILEAKQ